MFRIGMVTSLQLCGSFVDNNLKYKNGLTASRLATHFNIKPFYLLNLNLKLKLLIFGGMQRREKKYAF
jgi:hypothetical protein